MMMFIKGVVSGGVAWVMGVPNKFFGRLAGYCELKKGRKIVNFSNTLGLVKAPSHPIHRHNEYIKRVESVSRLFLILTMVGIN